LTPERWAQIEDLFHRAMECDLNQRTPLLKEACSSDPELRREVEALIACQASAGDHVQAAVRFEIDGFGFPRAGKVVSHYRVLTGLGGGGMGLVYRAEDIKLGRLVALKFLPEESAKDLSALARFEREARAASALEHPNICPIYEFGEHEGQPFLVMQLLEGQTLRELLENRRLENQDSHRTASSGGSALQLIETLDLAIQIADGLNAAHQKGIIHRDLKPENIFVTNQDQAKILDFGLAKLTRAAAVATDEAEPERRHNSGTADTPHDPSSATTVPFLSRTGVAMGTAGYMSPEQVRGEKLDARTDLFSFGLMLYEMATGERAFTGETGPVLQEAILKHTPIPARAVKPELPARLEKIINRALEKDREARYQTIGQIRADLESLKRGIGSRKQLRWWMLTAGFMALLLAGGVSWFAKHRPTSPYTLPDLKLQQLTINSSENRVTGGAISPDGRYLAYTDMRGMHIKLVGSDETQSVPQPHVLQNNSGVWEIVANGWFPDSKRFLANAHPAAERPDAWSPRTTGIWVVSVLGGPPHKIRDNALAWSLSPDGSLISFAVDDRDIWIMSQSGEQAHKLYQADAEKAICCLYFFRDGRVAYIISDKSGDTLVSRDFKGGPVARLLPPSEMKKMGDAAWLPDGRLIYSDVCIGMIMRTDQPCNYWVMRVDLRSGGIVDAPRRLTSWVGVWMTEPSATADGKRVAFLQSSGRGNGYLADIERGGKHVISSRRFTLEEGGEDTISAFTADSKSAIVASNRGDHYSLYKQSLNSDIQQPIVASVAGGLLENAEVSPDGKWVIAQVWPITGGPSVQLVRIPIDGGSPELIFSVREGSLSSCALAFNLCAVAEQSSDQRQMIITAFDPVKGRGSELARFEIDTNFDPNMHGLLWNISPDGTRLATARGSEGPIQIFSLRDQRAQVIRAKELDNIQLLIWAADGKGLFVSNRTKDGAEVVHVDLRGNTSVLWKCNGPRCFGGPSPDGRHLAIYDWKQSSNMWMMENF
jgi:eukaryotic-like serine/threonine-protein kinase